MSSSQDVGTVRLSDALILDAVEVGPGDLTAEGVFVLSTDAGSSAPRIILDAGTVLHGISVRVGGADVTSDSAGTLITVQCASDDGAVLVDESPAVILDPADRFSVAGGSTGLVGVDRRPIQLIYDGTANRWLAPDWRGVQQVNYASDGATFQLLESWDIAEGEFVGVTAEITIGYDSGASAFARTVFAHADARRRPGDAMTHDGTSPLNDSGNANLTVQWAANGNSLELSVRTTYVGNVTVLWESRTRRASLPT